MRGQLSIFDGTDQSLLSKSIKLIKEFKTALYHVIHAAM